MNVKRILLPILGLFLLSITSFCQNEQELIQEQKYKTLIEEGKRKLKYEGKNPEVSMVVGRSLYQLGEREEAIPYLEAAIEEPNIKSYIDAWALDFLGKIYFLRGEREKSKDFLIKARSLNATKNATYDIQNTLLLFGFEDLYNDWEIFETDNIIFHIQNTKMIGDVASYISERTKAYENIQEFFGSKLPKQIDFFVWESQLEGYRYLKKSLGFSEPIACLIHSYSFQTPGHELTHIVSHYAVSEFEKKNKFINEGIGVCFDQAKRNRMAFAKKSLKKSEIERISIKKIWENPDSINDAQLYAISGAFVEYLIEEGGKSNFLKLLPNQTFENAQRIYGEKLEKWIQYFEGKINKK